MNITPKEDVLKATDDEVQLYFNMVHMLDGWVGDTPNRYEVARLIERLRLSESAAKDWEDYTICCIKLLHKAEEQLVLESAKVAELEVKLKNAMSGSTEIGRVPFKP